MLGGMGHETWAHEKRWAGLLRDQPARGWTSQVCEVSEGTLEQISVSINPKLRTLPQQSESKMPITNAQATAFFTEAAQMGLSHRTRAFLQTEGINTVDDLGEFTTAEDWKQIVDNARKPPMIPDPGHPAAQIHQEPFRIPTKSLNRLKLSEGCCHCSQAL